MLAATTCSSVVAGGAREKAVRRGSRRGSSRCSSAGRRPATTQSPTAGGSAPVPAVAEPSGELRQPLRAAGLEPVVPPRFPHHARRRQPRARDRSSIAPRTRRSTRDRSVNTPVLSSRERCAAAHTICVRIVVLSDERRDRTGEEPARANWSSSLSVERRPM